MSIKSLNREKKDILCKKNIIYTGRKDFEKYVRIIKSRANLTVAHWFWIDSERNIFLSVRLT